MPVIEIVLTLCHCSLKT